MAKKAKGKRRKKSTMSERISFRVKPEEKLLIEKAVVHRDDDLSDWLRTVCVWAANVELYGHEKARELMASAPAALRVAQQTPQKQEPDESPENDPDLPIRAIDFDDD